MSVSKVAACTVSDGLVQPYQLILQKNESVVGAMDCGLGRLADLGATVRTTHCVWSWPPTRSTGRGSTDHPTAEMLQTLQLATVRALAHGNTVGQCFE